MSEHRLDANAWRLARRVASISAAAAGTAMAAGLGVGLFIAHEITRPARPKPEDVMTMSPFETGVPWEDIEFPSEHASHRVQAWWFPRPETRRVIIGSTGYRASKSGLIGIGSALWRAGFNVLLFDYYGHGTDLGGQRISLGYHEINDFFAAVRYAEERVPGAILGVVSFSMGASVAILGTAQRPQIRALVADSPFATHRDVVTHNVTRVLHLPGAPFVRMADMFFPALGGYRQDAVEPIRAIAKIAPRPLLLIHGTADELVPVQHAYRNFAAANEPKELWIAEGAIHCGTYFLDRPAYCHRVARFFDEHLREESISQAS
jgi:uncharacterized protein